LSLSLNSSTPDGIGSNEVEAFRPIFNTVRPHESLGDVPPMERYLSEPAEPHLCQPESVQES
jgi:hypothetical protein